MKAPQPTPLFKIFWIVDGVVKEEPGGFKDRPSLIGIVKAKARTLAATTHTMGTLRVVHSDVKPEDYQLKLQLTTRL